MIKDKQPNLFCFFFSRPFQRYLQWHRGEQYQCDDDDDGRSGHVVVNVGTGRIDRFHSGRRSRRNAPTTAIVHVTVIALTLVRIGGVGHTRDTRCWGGIKTTTDARPGTGGVVAKRAFADIIRWETTAAAVREEAGIALALGWIGRVGDAFGYGGGIIGTGQTGYARRIDAAAECARRTLGQGAANRTASSGISVDGTAANATTTRDGNWSRHGNRFGHHDGHGHRFGRHDGYKNRSGCHDGSGHRSGRHNGYKNRSGRHDGSGH
jgi:hypothetical protein